MDQQAHEHDEDMGERSQEPPKLIAKSEPDHLSLNDQLTKTTSTGETEESLPNMNHDFESEKKEPQQIPKPMPVSLNEYDDTDKNTVEVKETGFGPTPKPLIDNRLVFKEYDKDKDETDVEKKDLNRAPKFSPESDLYLNEYDYNYNDDLGVPHITPKPYPDTPLYVNEYNDNNDVLGAEKKDLHKTPKDIPDRPLNLNEYDDSEEELGDEKKNLNQTSKSAPETPLNLIEYIDNDEDLGGKQKNLRQMPDSALYINEYDDSSNKDLVEERSQPYLGDDNFHKKGGSITENSSDILDLKTKGESKMNEKDSEEMGDHISGICLMKLIEN